MAEKKTHQQVEKILSDLDGSSDSFVRLAEKLRNFRSDDTSNFLMQLLKGLKEKFPPDAEEYKDRAGYTRVLLELANAQGKISPDAARSTFHLINKLVSSKLAMSYISWAQFELSYKNLIKAKLLMKSAKSKNAGPTWLLDKAFENLVAGKKDLLHDVIDPWENVDTNVIIRTSSHNSSFSVAAHTTIIPAASSATKSFQTKDPESPNGGTMPILKSQSSYLKRVKSKWENQKGWNLGMPIRAKATKPDCIRPIDKKLEESFSKSLEIKPLLTPVAARDRREELTKEESATFEFKPLDLSQDVSSTTSEMLKGCQEVGKSSEIKPLITKNNDDCVVADTKDSNKEGIAPECQSSWLAKPSKELVRVHVQTVTSNEECTPLFDSTAKTSVASDFLSSVNPLSSTITVACDPKNSQSDLSINNEWLRPSVSRLDSGNYTDDEMPLSAKESLEPMQAKNDSVNLTIPFQERRLEDLFTSNNDQNLDDRQRNNSDSGFQCEGSPFKIPTQLPPRSVKKQLPSSSSLASLTEKGTLVPFSNDVLQEKNISISTPNGLQHVMLKSMQASSTTKKGKYLRIKSQSYKVVAVIGRGGSSKVYEVENEKRQRFAVKRVELEDVDDFIMQSYLNEINLLLKLKGEPSIIELYDWEVRDEVLYVLMERGDMDLSKYLKTHKQCGEDVFKMYWKQMLCAVNAIHKQGIIHTDLKPANFLLVNNNLKLIDFGIANSVQANKTSVTRECQLGTLNYMAPESLMDTSFQWQESDGKPKLRIRRATDVWSLGCILYYMLYGKTPYQHISNQVLKIEAIKTGKTIEFPPIQNTDLLDSIKGCLRHSPQARYTIDDLLSHPFLSNGEVRGLLEALQAAINEVSKDAHFCVDERWNKTLNKGMDNSSLANKENLRAFANQFAETAVNSPKSVKRVRQGLFKEPSQLKEHEMQALKGKFIF